MNMISVIVISFSTASLFIVLSVLVGLKLWLSYTNKFDPDFRIKPKKENKLILSGEELSKINFIHSVVESSPVIENKVVLNFKDKTVMAVLRGVGPHIFKDSSNRFSTDSGDWLEGGYSEVLLVVQSRDN